MHKHNTEQYCILIIIPVTEAARQKSERVLVFSELGISRAPVACIAYLMKKNKWTLQVSPTLSTHLDYVHIFGILVHTCNIYALVISRQNFEC